MHPIIFLLTTWVNHMGQVVFRIGQDECRVTDFIGPVGTNR
jgi:hypothetical protein